MWEATLINGRGEKVVISGDARDVVVRTVNRVLPVEYQITAPSPATYTFTDYKVVLRQTSPEPGMKRGHAGSVPTPRPFTGRVYVFGQRIRGSEFDTACTRVCIRDETFTARSILYARNDSNRSDEEFAPMVCALSAFATIEHLKGVTFYLVFPLRNPGTLTLCHPDQQFYCCSFYDLQSRLRLAGAEIYFHSVDDYLDNMECVRDLHIADTHNQMPEAAAKLRTLLS